MTIALQKARDAFNQPGDDADYHQRVRHLLDVVDDVLAGRPTNRWHIPPDMACDCGVLDCARKAMELVLLTPFNHQCPVFVSDP